MASPPAALPPAAMKQLKAMQGKHTRQQEKLDSDYKKKLKDLDTKIEKAEQGLQSLLKQKKDAMEQHKNDKVKLLKEQQAESANVNHSQQSAADSSQRLLAGQPPKRRIQTASPKNAPQKIQLDEPGSKHVPIDLSSDGESESKSPQHAILSAQHQPFSEQRSLGSSSTRPSTLNVVPSVNKKNINGDHAQASRNNRSTIASPSSPFIKGKQPITPSRPDSTPRKRVCSIDISSSDDNEEDIPEREGRKKASKGKGPVPKKQKPDPVAARFGFKGLASGPKASGRQASGPPITPSKAPRKNAEPSGRGSLDKTSTKATPKDDPPSTQDLNASPTPRKRTARLNAEAKLAQYSLAVEDNASDADGDSRGEPSKRCYRQSSDIDGVKHCLRRMSLTPTPARDGCKTNGRRFSTASSITPAMSSYEPTSPRYGSSIREEDPTYAPTSLAYAHTDGEGDTATFTPTSPVYSRTGGEGDTATFTPTSPAYARTMSPYTPTSPGCHPTIGRQDNTRVGDRDRKTGGCRAPRPVVYDVSDEEEPDISHYEMRNGIIVCKDSRPGTSQASKNTPGSLSFLDHQDH
ncbi:hypothetical protein IQ07DRAFT_685439 [Pyrenochaeta sp. DS3sAY3a]|nr:hypothetical protein IQ07DRAFT_685439 [Pyrenochaeta sp. DS3sAY3a]